MSLRRCLLRDQITNEMMLQILHIVVNVFKVRTRLSTIRVTVTYSTLTTGFLDSWIKQCVAFVSTTYFIHERHKVPQLFQPFSSVLLVLSTFYSVKIFQLLSPVVGMMMSQITLG